jgi:hypothetical protein
LKQGYELLLPKIKQAEFLNSTLETLVAEDTTQDLRLNILILVRPILNDTWTEEHYDTIKNVQHMPFRILEVLSCMEL